MSRKPCLPIVLLYITGILINIPYSYKLLLISIFCFFILFFLKNKISIIALYLSIILFGSFSCKLHSSKGAFHITNYIGEKGDITGTIVDYPVMYPERVYLTIKVEKFDGERASGLLSVSTQERNLSLGDRLFIPNAKIKEPKAYKNPGMYNRKKTLSRQKIYGSVWADSVIKQGIGEINPLLFFASRIKIRAEKIISLLLEKERGFLLGAILGEREGISNEINKAFADTGTVHILSASGLHLALLFGFLVLVFQSLGIKKPYKFILCLPILFLFCLITGSSCPTVRSLIIAVVFISSLTFERETNIYNTLAIAVFIILLLNPYEIYNIGFQLSFVACASLVYLTPKLRIKSGNTFIFISSCFAASIGIMPFVLFWFGMVSLISPIANLFVIPLVGILLPFGLIFILLGFINIYLASFLIIPLSFLTDITMETILLFAGIPASSVSLHSPSIPIVLLLYLLIIVFAERIKKLFIPTLIILNIFLWYNVCIHKEFEAVFLDVGLGDSIFIRSPGGCNILIDGGPPFAGRSCVLPFLQYKGIDRIDILIATHSDSDHVGGLIDCLTKLNVRRIFYNGLSSPSRTYQGFLRTIKEKGLILEKLKMGDRIIGMDLDIKVLSPPESPFSKDNDNSIVLKLASKDISFLLPGDIEEHAISNLSLSYKENLKSVVLKAPHHGRKAIPQSFLSLVEPKVIIAQGWDSSSCDIISTNFYGAITIKSGKYGFRVILPSNNLFIEL